MGALIKIIIDFQWLALQLNRKSQGRQRKEKEPLKRLEEVKCSVRENGMGMVEVGRIARYYIIPVLWGEKKFGLFIVYIYEVSIYI